MNRKDNETYEMLTRVADFLTTNVGLFAITSAAPEIAAAHGTGLKTLAEESRNVAAAEIGLRATGGIRTAALENLKTKVHHASQIGKALNLNTFSLPVKKSYRGLIDVARAFAVEAVPFASEFTKHGVPPESITAAVTAFEEALLNGTNAKAKRKAAKEKWTAAIEATLLTVKRLDVLVETTLAAEPGPLATYEAARTVRHGRGRKTEESTVTESTPLPAPATTTATAA